MKFTASDANKRVKEAKQVERERQKALDLERIKAEQMEQEEVDRKKQELERLREKAKEREREQNLADELREECLRVLTQKAVYAATDGHKEVLLDKWEFSDVEDLLVDRGFEIITKRYDPNNFDPHGDRLKCLAPKESLELRDKLSKLLNKVQRVASKEFFDYYARIATHKADANLLTIIEKIKRLSEEYENDRGEEGIAPISDFIRELKDSVEAHVLGFFEEPEFPYDIHYLGWARSFPSSNPGLLCPWKLSWISSSSGQLVVSEIFSLIKQTADGLGRHVVIPIDLKGASVEIIIGDRHVKTPFDGNELKEFFSLFEYRATTSSIQRKRIACAQDILKIRW